MKITNIDSINVAEAPPGAFEKKVVTPEIQRPVGKELTDDIIRKTLSYVAPAPGTVTELTKLFDKKGSETWDKSWYRVNKFCLAHCEIASWRGNRKLFTLSSEEEILAEDASANEPEVEAEEMLLVA